MNTERNMNPGPKGGALDETFLPTLLQKVIGMEAFNTCHRPVRETTEEDSADDKYMGCCATFLEWSDVPRHDIQIGGCNFTGVSSPCSYQKIAIKEMKNLYDAGFLFMRKVDRDALLVHEDGNEIPLIDLPNLLPL